MTELNRLKRAAINIINGSTSNSNATSSFVLQYAGYMLRIYENGSICHGYLTNISDDILAMNTKIHGRGWNRNDLISDDEAKRYLHWVFNKSPIAHVFITKNTRLAVSRGSFALNVEASHPEILVANQMVRHSWEKTHVVQAWLELVDRGVEERLAFLLASVKGYIPTGSQVHWKGGASQHSAVYPEFMSVDGAKNFIAGNVLDKPCTRQPFRTHHSIHEPGSWYIWGAKNGRSSLSFTQKVLKDYPYTEVATSRDWDGTQHAMKFDTPETCYDNMAAWLKTDYIKDLLG